MDTKLKNIKLMMLSLIFIVFSLTIIQVSRAASITVIVEGNLRYVDTELSVFFSTGDLYRLEYTFNSLSADSDPDNLNRGIYVNAISSLSVSIGGYTAAMSGDSEIKIDNDRFDGDIYSLWLSDPMIGDTINGYNLSSQSPLLLTGNDSGTAFVDDSLVTYALNSPDFVGFLALEFINSNCNSALLEAEISSFQVSSIPIPSSFLLFFSGLFSLLGANRFRKN